MVSTRLKLLIFLSAASFGLSQAPSGAHIELPRAQVTAGDQVDLTLTFDSPAPCSVNVQVNLVSERPPQMGVAFTGMTQVGQTIVKLHARIPLDVPGGKYVSQRVGTLWPCPGYSSSKEFEISSVTMDVTAVADHNNYPTRAETALSVTQKQFLETKASDVGQLSSELNSRLEKGTADLPELRNFLAGLTDSAHLALIKTESEYAKVMPRGEKPPAFFADLNAQYTALSINLKAPIPGLARTSFGRANLVRIQLKKRKRMEDLASTLPPDAIAVLQLLKDNMLAYKYVEDTGRETFDARLASIPDGARVQFRKLIDEEYTDYPTPTNVPNATFELCTWVFKFHKEGCKRDQVLRIDPYQDPHPNIVVEFTHCTAR